MEPVLLVLTNMPNLAAAQNLAYRLVERKLAACVNIMPGVQSVYRWQGAVEQAQEVTMLIKTTQRRYPDLQAAIQAHHPYKTPEIIAVPITAGLPAYLDWIAQETKEDGNV